MSDASIATGSTGTRRTTPEPVRRVRRLLPIAAAEWTLLLRSRLALVAFAAALLLGAAAALVSLQFMSDAAEERAHHQAEADAAFRAQPDRHPHRMVHYGHYVFRTPAPLTLIDPGVDAYTGTAIFLEGHRRNTATFAEAGETSVLTRFGAVSPAFVLQTLAPLLLILVGFACVVREREGGTLPQLLAQGVDGPTLLLGKALALLAAAALMLLPLTAVAAWLLGTGQDGAAPILTLVLAHAVYLGFWCLLIVAVSARVGSSSGALMLLLGCWLLTTVLVPRVATDVAGALVPMPTQAETEIAVKNELARLGDSHNADDPSFESFRDRVLRQYGVERIEDLPVNFRGLVSLHGEATSSAVMARLAAERAALERRQASVVDAFSVASPLLALRRVSMTSAGSDLANHQRFLDAAEDHRFDLVQRLNTLHAEQLSLEDDLARSSDPEAEQRTRVSAEYWATMPAFRFAPTPAGERARAALPAFGVLLLWLLAAAVLLAASARRIGAR